LRQIQGTQSSFRPCVDLDINSKDNYFLNDSHLLVLL
jgi:hypothetical protein